MPNPSTSTTELTAEEKKAKFKEGLKAQLSFKETVNGASVFNLESLLTSVVIHGGIGVGIGYLLSKKTNIPGLHLLSKIRG